MSDAANKPTLRRTVSLEMEGGVFDHLHIQMVVGCWTSSFGMKLVSLLHRNAVEMQNINGCSKKEISLRRQLPSVISVE